MLGPHFRKFRTIFHRTDPSGTVGDLTPAIRSRAVKCRHYSTAALVGRGLLFVAVDSEDPAALETTEFRPDKTMTGDTTRYERRRATLYVRARSCAAV